MTRLFVTASGTDLGKTFVTASLIASARRRGLSVRAVKPLATGFDPAALAASDPGILLEAQGLAPAAIDRVTPWRFSAPLSPDLAAAREGRQVPVDEIIAFSRAAIAGPEQLVLIEGIGGVMVPLDETRTVLAWIAALDMPVVLVVGSYLGALSHALTALRVLDAAGIETRAVVVSETPGSTVTLDDTVAVLRRFTSAEVIALPRLAASSPPSPVEVLLGGN